MWVFDNLLPTWKKFRTFYDSNLFELFTDATGEQAALPPVPQRPAIVNNAMDFLHVLFPRLDASGVTTTDIVPSTSNHQQPISCRDSQANALYVPRARSGESIISLLLKLHSQLSGVPDSYNPDQPTVVESEAGSSAGASSSNANPDSPSPADESRIGDGPFFISQLLKKIAALDLSCKQNIVETRNKLWPRTKECEDAKREREHREREERRKRAKERQQKLMAEFANKQKQFMKKAMETGKYNLILENLEWNINRLI